MAGGVIGSINQQRLLKKKETNAKMFPFEKSFDSKYIFIIYNSVFWATSMLQIVLKFKYGVGVSGVLFDNTFAVASRISNFIMVMFFINILFILKEKQYSTLRKIAFVNLFIYVLLSILQTSKGGLINVGLVFIVCYQLMRQHVSVRIIVGFGVLLIVTVAVYAPLMMAARSEFISYTRDNMVIGLESVITHLSYFMKDSLFVFLRRLGGFDWFLGFATVGREQFPYWVSMNGDLIQVINSLIPGDIIKTPEYINIAQLMPIMLRGYPSIESVGGHGENMGIVGMAYLYFGLFSAFVFFFSWSFISEKVFYSNFSIFIKVLFINCFVISLFSGGGFISPMMNFYQGIIGLLILYCVYIILHQMHQTMRKNKLKCIIY